MSSTVVSPSGGLRSRFAAGRGLVAMRDYGIVVVLVALFIALSIGSPQFLSTTNLLNILDQWAPLGLIACGGTLVIIAGGFDLSVGAIYAVGAAIAAKLALEVDAVIGLIAGVGIATLAGLLNGALASVGRINALIVTLATAMVFRGVALVITDGQLISVEDATFQFLGNGSLLGVTYISWIFIVFALVCGFVLSRQAFGRYIYACGGNPEAARLAGIRVNLVRTITFGVSGAAAGLGGVLAASQIGTAQADMGTGIELQVIGAIVIGGTSILGGQGAIWRTVVGLFILALINNGFNLLNIDSQYQLIIQGAIILIAVGADIWARRLSGR